MDLSNVSDQDLIKEVINRGYKVIPNNVWYHLTKTVPMTARNIERTLNKVVTNEFGDDEETVKERLDRVKVGDGFKQAAGILGKGNEGQ